MSNPSNKPSMPSDLELMLYADGELSAERSAAVEAYLGSLAAPAQKLAALGLVSDLVRESALDKAAPADSIADAVMTRIAGEAKPAGRLVALHDVSAKRSPGPKPQGFSGARRVGNDNARGIFALAAIAVAAAAGMMLWGRAEPPSARIDDRAAVVAEAATEAHPAQSAAPATAAEAPKPDVEHGVEVAAVDFGARGGTIFYVPKGAAHSSETTTVVWLSDDAAGGD